MTGLATVDGVCFGGGESITLGLGGLSFSIVTDL